MIQKHIGILREGGFYLAVGALLTGLGYGVYVLLFFLFAETVSYLLLYGASYLTMLLVSYLTYSRFVFRSPATLRGLFRYFWATQLSAWLTLAGMFTWTEILTLNPLYAPLLPLILIVPIMFLLSRRYIFTRKKVVPR